MLREIAMKRFVAVFFRKAIVVRGLKFSLVVGSILVLINHLYCCFAGDGIKHLESILLTYSVPYFVSSFSSTQAVLESEDA